MNLFIMRISEGAGLKTVTIKRWFTVLGFLKINDEMSTGYVIKPECLKEGWITSGSQMVIYLAFHLYTDTMPTVRERSRKQDQIRECRRYSVSDIFACNYARYFWAAVQIRYPEYCMG